MEDPEIQNPSKAKETSDRLMSIIRTLSYGADTEQRERQKHHLEKEYKESDKKLDKLVQGHRGDLTSIIQSYTTISSRLTSSQERIRAIKDNLQSCKNLLHCKRDELRKLWQEGQEHKMIVEMLDQIDKIKKVNDTLQGHIDRRHYLHATDLLIKSTSLLDNDLSQVEGLHDVRLELQSKREELYEILLEALHRQIYTKPMSSVVQGFQRSGSQRSSRGKTGTMERENSMLKNALLKSTNQTTVESVADQNLKQLLDVRLEDVSAPQHVTEDLHVDAEQDPVKFLAVIIESLATLKKMPEAIENLRGQMRPGLLGIVQRASQQVYDNAYVEGENLENIFQPAYLLEILKLVFTQFRVVARIHEIIIANMQRIKRSSGPQADFTVYNNLEVWEKIQRVLVMLLGDYLDVRSNNAPQIQASTETSEDIGSFFTKKRPQRPYKMTLFKFSASTHALSMDSYMREQRQEFYGTGDMKEGGGTMADPGKSEYVCKPTPYNITMIYNPLQKFIAEVEQAIKAKPGSSSLSGFVTEFLNETYLHLVSENITKSITQATRGSDAHRVTIDLRTQRELCVPKPLLQSTVAVARSVGELQTLMHDLPDYSHKFIKIICDILTEYRETCRTVYKGVVMSEMDEKRIISATWAKDEDIGRFLRSLPNWRNLKESSGEEMEISEEDLRAMNSKESSILTSNLSSTDALIPPQEVISDVGQLKALANMVESLEWLSSTIVDFASELGTQDLQSMYDAQTKSKKSTLPPVSENTLLTLRSLSQDFQDLGDLCLLVLHLETRVHCFYYLMPLAQKSNYGGAIDDMDPDAQVIKLNKDLSSIEDALHQSLQPQKFRYIFEGLGHLVSTILINSTQYLKRMNENGIKKMCRNIFAIQQSLTNITMSRESDLDHARQYYEMMYLKSDEMVKVVMERGQQFTEQEYINLLALAHRSGRGGTEAQFNARVNRLENVLKEYELLV